MEKITSFTINHLSPEPDVYISRKDAVDPEMVTTFDLHVTTSNKEPVMNTTGTHTPERFGATFLRDHMDFGACILCFGPVGCRTGFYLLPRGGYGPIDILPLLYELFHFITNFADEVPGAAAHDCGNCLDMNLPMAEWGARRYLERALNAPRPSQLRYPD